MRECQVGNPEREEGNDQRRQADCDGDDEFRCYSHWTESISLAEGCRLVVKYQQLEVKSLGEMARGEFSLKGEAWASVLCPVGGPFNNGVRRCRPVTPADGTTDTAASRDATVIGTGHLPAQEGGPLAALSVAKPQPCEAPRQGCCSSPEIKPQHPANF